MRLNYIIETGMAVSMNHVRQACINFFDQYKVIPDTIRMSYHDHNILLSQMPYNVEVLEKGKDYGLFLAVPGGMVELQVLELDDETTMHMSGGSMRISGGSMIVVESTKINREFERHILNKE